LALDHAPPLEIDGMGTARARGFAGEEMAAAYFELIGCASIARNVKLAGVEVDLLVDDDGTRVLAEVKTRTRSDYGGAALAVDHRKRERLLRAAALLLSRGARRVRIDVIAIETSSKGAVLTHYRNALTEA
jgi:putative endonuclease